MAEFALGLTKTAVEGTLSRVKSAIEEEGKLKVRVQNDLLFITGEFQMMQSFLNVANKERAKSEVVRTWVRQLRDLAFDVEDCVEFVVHLDKTPAWWWRVVPSCMAPPLALDEAVAEIKQLKARVEDVSQRNTRYNLISDSKPVSPTEQPAVAAAGSSAFHMLREVWEVAGKRREIGDLRELITREGSDLQVISVWGSRGGDLGTTSIFRKAYCDPGICQDFKSRAWVKLRHPFNPDEFLNSLLTQFCKSSHQENVDVDFRTRITTEGILVKAKLTQQLMIEQRYLVILEEVSAVVEWENIKMYLPDSKNGSRIIMSTQDLGIAILGTGEPYLVSELRQFSDGHSLCAFFKKISGHRSDMGELKWQIRLRGVISVHGSTVSKSVVISRLYRNIFHKHEEFDGVEFEKYRWVHMVYPLDLTNFARCLFLDLSSYGFYNYEFNKLLSNLKIKDRFCPLTINERQAKEDMEAVLKMGEANLMEECHRLLREHDYLVVIDGLRSKDDWDLIKSTFLSEPTKGSMVVITTEIWVARHCVDDGDRVLNSKDFIADFAEGHAFSSGTEEAHNWTNNFELDVHKSEQYKLHEALWNTGVIPVWGIAGIGKSTLVRGTYYGRMLGLFRRNKRGSTFNLPRYFKMYSWVDVPHPFNLTDLSRRLFLDFYSNDLQAKETAVVGIIEGQDPIQGCRTFLREYECLVVIDGIRSKHEWNLIKSAFLSGPNRGTIIVITNEESVARHCVDNKSACDNNCDCMVNVKGLDADTALNLFKKALSNREFTPEQMELSKLIVAKCGGIPKVIAALSEFLGEEEFDSWLFEGINDYFMRKLQTLPLVQHLRGLFSWMQSYFDACSDSLKPCIFYLSVFPVGHNIRQKRLLRRWIAESYSRDTFDNTAEENGKMLFSELVDLSIIQQSAHNITWQTNGFFHEYIISRPMEDNLVFSLEGHCGLNSQRTGQHLTIRSNWDRDMNVFESIDFSRLRSLTVFGEWRPFFISTNIKMRLVRVLDLEDTSGVKDGDLDQIGEILPRLKFLSLRGCGDITRLPNSLGGLRQLQTLDVRYTSILILPPAIIELNKLQYIRAGTIELWHECGMFTSPSAFEDFFFCGEAAVEDDYGTYPSQPAEVAAIPAADWDGADASQQDVAPRSTEDGSGTVPSQPPPPTEPTRQDTAGTGPSNTPPPTEPTLEEDGAGTGPSQPPPPALASLAGPSQPTPIGVVGTSSPSRCRPHSSVSSWLSKLCSKHKLDNGGVEAPAGVGNLKTLHTFGVINVSGAGGKAILKEIKKLTQLCKLGVSGINGENAQEFFAAISGHQRLESLSMRVDKDKKGSFVCLDDIFKLPKSIKSLKLYGHVHKLPFWIKQSEDILMKLYLEMTIITQEDINTLGIDLVHWALTRLCVKLIQDGELHFCYPPGGFACDSEIFLEVLRIDCSSRLQVTFHRWITHYVRLLIIHCSSGSSLRISGLENLQNLRVVWLKGSYGDGLKRELQQQLAEHREKPVLKLEQPPST